MVGLPLLEAGLQAAVLTNHEVEISKIVKYVSHHVLVVTIEDTQLRGLILANNFKMMKLLVKSKIQVKRTLKNGI